jgi:hypothetical protein
MAQRTSGYARQRDDAYETPAWVTRVVVPYLRQHCRHVWDPANGPASKIASVLRDEKFATIATNDNFLARTSLPDADVDGVCTSPPYGYGGRLACRFIAHALELAPVVAMYFESITIQAGRARTYSGIARHSIGKSFCSIASLGLSVRAHRIRPTITVGSSGIEIISGRRRSPTRGGRDDPPPTA